MDIEKSSAADWKDWLARLVPEDGPTITDAAGHAYQLPARLVGRQQVRFGRVLEELLSAGVDAPTRAKIAAVLGGDKDVEAIIAAAGVAMSLLDDSRLALVDKAFETAYPAVLADARTKVTGAAQLGALDLFPGEEVVRALLPLFVVPARRLLAA